MAQGQAGFMILQTVTPEALANLEVFSTLDPHQLLLASHKVELLQVPSGTQLFAIGDVEAVEYFLLEGSVQLLSDDGKKLQIAADQPSATKPLARLKPRKYSACALTECALIKVESALLKAWEQDGVAAIDFEQSYGVSELKDDLDPVMQLFVQDFRQALASKRFVLPSLPEVALRVRQLIEDENTNVATLAAVVNADPAIAAKLIRAANSPVYRGGSTVVTTQQAVVRLGMKVTRQLVLSFAIRDLFVTRSPALKRLMLQTWKQSMEVAAISFVVARMSKEVAVTSEEALLAGLLSDIGMMALLAFAQSYPSLHDQPETLRALLDLLGAELGEQILRQWNFREDVIEVVVNAHQWQRQHSGPADLCDVVQVAKMHSYLWNKQASPVNPQQFPALARLRLGELSPELTLTILDEAKTQVTEVKTLLGG